MKQKYLPPTATGKLHVSFGDRGRRHRHLAHPHVRSARAATAGS
jgi:hypothetical protein